MKVAFGWFSLGVTYLVAKFWKKSCLVAEAVQRITKMGETKQTPEEKEGIEKGLKYQAEELEPLTGTFCAPFQRRKKLIDHFPRNDIPNFAK